MRHLTKKFTYYHLAILTLSAAFMLQTFSQGFIIADYYVHTAAYAKVCINKSRPALHCNGKCQMMKKMQEAEKKEQENAERFGNLKLDVLSTRSYYPSIIPPAGALILAVKNPNEPSFRHTDQADDFFQPPRLV